MGLRAWPRPRLTGFFAVVFIVGVVAGCAGRTDRPAAAATEGRTESVASSLPVVTALDFLKPAAPEPVKWAASSLADDFVALMFHDEWARARPRLVKWEGRVRVRIMEPELDGYSDHVKSLAGAIGDAAPGLDIRYMGDGPGEIEIRVASARAIAAASPGALCLMAADRGSWRERRARIASGARRIFEAPEAITIFVPRWAAPWLIRACLNEEIAQVLGPRNDLSWLEDSMFNDDAMHLAPTAFDFLMLRVLYDERLRTGMTPHEARAAALRVLRDLGYNDAGAQRPSRRARPQFDRMIGVIARLSNAGPLRRASKRAADFAEGFAALDHRRGAALVSAASAARRSGDARLAFALLGEASLQFSDMLGENSLRRADADARLAALHLRRGDPEAALALIETATPVLARHRSEAAYALSLRLRAQTLQRLGRKSEADEAARETMIAASFAFGPNSARVRRWRREFHRDGLAI